MKPVLFILAIAACLAQAPAPTYTVPSTSNGGTVTAVTGSSPLSSSGGTTPAISCSTCITTGGDINSSNQVTNLSHVSNASVGNAALANPSTTVNGQTCTLGASCSILPSVTISTSGPVADPGGNFVFLVNNAAGALTFDLPAGSAGLQRCYRNATGVTGALTIAVTTSNAIDLLGTNGTTSTGTLVSSGALGDSVCLWSDATNHWYAVVGSGSWTNN